MMIWPAVVASATVVEIRREQAVVGAVTRGDLVVDHAAQAL